MPVPANPTVGDIVTAGLKAGGIPSRSATQITQMTDDGFQNVKSEIWLANTRDALLETSTLLLPVKGYDLLTLPTDFDHEIFLDLYAGPDDHRITLAGGGTGTVTFPSSFSKTEEEMIGLTLLTLSGTGSGQWRQCAAWNNTTKVFTPVTAFSSTTSTDTVCLLATQSGRLLEEDTGRMLMPTVGVPSRYFRTGIELHIRPTPDHVYYPIVLRYGPNLTRLDESGTLFVKHLRERRALWIQGVKVQTMFRFDDARAQREDARWHAMLALYGGHNLTYAQMALHGGRTIYGGAC